MFKKTDEKICYKRLSLYNHCLIYLPGHILDDEKGVGALFKQKGKK